MKQVLLMAVLAAGILLAGCAKDNDDMETKGNTEQQALIKEQIVGVWRNGDYWVSFDGNGRKPVEGEPIEFGPVNQPAYYDGHLRAVLRKGDSCYNDGGRYIIEGNKINVYNGSRGGNPKYVVTDISDTSVTFIITIPASFDDDEDCTYTMSFIKERNVSGSD